MNYNSTNEQTYFTPLPIVRSLGNFDLDPCSHVDRPWSTAKIHWTIQDDGLSKDWFGRVWLNPPYNDLKSWLKKMAARQFGIALLLARTDTEAFHRYVFPMASSILYLNKRIRFYDKNGDKTRNNPGAPSVAIAYSSYDSDMLESSDIIKGHHQVIGPTVILVANACKNTWKVIVGQAMKVISGPATLNEIYSAVYQMAPLKVKGNIHYKAKIRQTLQYYFKQKSRGIWQ